MMTYSRDSRGFEMAAHLLADGAVQIRECNAPLFHFDAGMVAFWRTRGATLPLDAATTIAIPTIACDCRTCKRQSSR